MSTIVRAEWVRRLLRSAAGLALAAVVALPAAAETLLPREIFTRAVPARAPSAEEILRRALDNLFGFDGAVQLEIERKTGEGAPEVSEFLVQRLRARDARRLLTVSVRPAAVRGNRVLQLNYDDGREETFAFVPSMGTDPVRVRYRLAEPFLATWYQIGLGEPAPALRALAEYEVLGIEPTIAGGEPAYRLSLRSIVPRGYDRTELIVARSDAVILEQRQYGARSQSPVLIAQTSRAHMVSFAERTVPTRIRYSDRVRNAELEVRLRHSPLPENSDALFVPGTFHRVALSVLETP
jgi:hypothetical protein